jgi:Tol biopolymer transport system component
VDGQGSPRKVPGITSRDWLAGVAPDGKSVIVITNTDFVSEDISRVDLATGRRAFIKKIGPTDSAGTFLFQNGFVTPDGKYYAYSYNQLLGELYTVTGLK